MPSTILLSLFFTMFDHYYTLVAPEDDMEGLLGGLTRFHHVVGYAKGQLYTMSSML